MNVDAELRRIEEQSLNVAHFAPQIFYDGWLLRLLPGRTKRARSVSAFFGTSRDVAHKIRHCEEVYAEAGLPALFRSTPFDLPRDLDVVLAAHGYTRFDDTLVMVAKLDQPPHAGARGDLDVRMPSLAEYCAAVAAIRGSSDEQRAVHQARLAGTPIERRGAVVYADGRPVASGQLACEDGIAGLFDVVVADGMRRQGHATALCERLFAWAWDHGMRTLYLQVTADNEAAVALYRRFGFTAGYGYHYRARPHEIG
ncbi:MAG TPA: GNAT family N-acetyltransferase [Casimicrobiaceae bacterium]|jgi:ribosomal protein S18 acetylase RimI-like enzyme